MIRCPPVHLRRRRCPGPAQSSSPFARRRRSPVVAAVVIAAVVAVVAAPRPASPANISQPSPSFPRRCLRYTSPPATPTPSARHVVVVAVVSAAASCRRSRCRRPFIAPRCIPGVISAPAPAVALSQLPTGPLAGRRRGSRRCGSPLCSLRCRLPGRASRPRSSVVRAEAASVRRRPVSSSHAHSSCVPSVVVVVVATVIAASSSPRRRRAVIASVRRLRVVVASSRRRLAAAPACRPASSPPSILTFILTSVLTLSSPHRRLVASSAPSSLRCRRVAVELSCHSAVVAAAFPASSPPRPLVSVPSSFHRAVIGPSRRS